MAIDPTTGALVPDSGPGNLSQYGFSGFGGGGLLGDALSNPLFNFGAGLLANSGPSLTPQSGFSNIGKALGYASDAQTKAIENQIRRQSLLETAQEQQGLQRVQDLIKTNPQLLQDQPLLAGLLSTGYKPAIQGVATALSDPSYGINLAVNRANLADKVSTNSNLYVNASTGEAAVNFLKDKPYGETLIKSPLVLQIAQGVKTAGDVLPQLKSLLPKGMSDTDAAAVLDAASTLVASKDALVQSGGIVGDTSNVGLDFYSRAFKQARERAETIAKGGGKPFELPQPPMVAFGETPQPVATKTATTTPPPPATTPPDATTGGGLSYSPQAGVVRTPPSQHVVRDLPPNYYQDNPPPSAPAAAQPAPFFSMDTLRNARDALGFGPTPAAPAAAATTPPPAAPPPTTAPAVTKVQTSVIDPATGNAAKQYARLADGKRATPKGQLFIYKDASGQLRVYRSD